MKKLIIIRGPSGSGKSTAAKDFLSKNVGLHFETDEFFMKDGKYVFDASKLGDAHNNCQKRIRKAMQGDTYPLVLSNTSMTRWELSPYLELAKTHSYEVVVYRTKGPWDPDTLNARNLHNVPIEIIRKQINKYQPLENEIEYDG